MPAAVASSSFDLSFRSRIAYGLGCAREAGSSLATVGARRPGVVASRSGRETATFAEWLSALEEQVGAEVPVFGETRPHTPRSVVLAAAELLRDAECDAVVSFGGGSAIDTAKGAALALALGLRREDDFDRFASVQGSADDPLKEALGQAAVLPHAAIPTTLSGAQSTTGAGITDSRSGHKQLYMHESLGARFVLIDASVTVQTPREVWAATGAKAIDHAVEGLYSTKRSPPVEVLTLFAFKTLVRDLVASVEPVEVNLERRGRVLTAAGLTRFGWSRGALGASHALGHQVGARWQVPHGVTSAILLPAVIDLNGPADPGAFEQMAHALGRSAKGAAAIAAIREAVAEIFDALRLPRRLREAGVDGTAGFVDVAAAALRDPIMAGNPRALTVDDLVAILEEVY